MLGRSRNWSVKFDGAETARETRKQSIEGGGSNTLRVGKWKATSEGTWEKSWVCASVGEGRKGVAPIEYSSHHSELTGLPAIRKLCFPGHPPHHPLHTSWTWGCLPSRRAGLNNCWKPTTAGAVPALACLPFGGATPLRSSTKHLQPRQKACSPEKLEQAWPGCEKICLHSRTVLPSWAALGKSLFGSK